MKENIRVFHDQQIWQIIWRNICQTKKILTIKAMESCAEWEIFQVNYSHTHWFQKLPKSKKLSGAWTKFIWKIFHSAQDSMA